MLVLANFRIIDNMSPFTAPLLFALIVLAYNPYFVILEFLIAGAVIDYSVTALLISLSQAGFAFVLYLVIVIFKNKKTNLFSYLLLFLSHAAFIYFNFISWEYVLLSALSIIISMLLLYVYKNAIENLMRKGYWAEFMFEDKILFVFCILTFFMGLSSIYTSFNFVKIVGVLVLLLVSELIEEKTTFIMAIIMGLGTALTTGRIDNIAMFAIFAITSFVFRNKYIKAIMILLTDQILLFVLNVNIIFSLENLIAMTFILLLFIALPTKFIEALKNNVGRRVELSLSNYFEENQRLFVSQKICALSEAFKEINIQYKSLVVGELDKKKAIEFVSTSVYENVCSKCIKKDECYKDLYVKNGIESYIEIGFNKDKTNLLDVPLQLSTCSRLAQITSFMISEVNDVKKFVNQKSIEDKKNLTISNQFLDTCEILKQIGINSFDAKIVRNNRQTLIEKMKAVDITIKDAAEVYSNKQFKELVLLVKNEDSTKAKLIEIANKFYKFSFYLSKQELSDDAGWSVVVLTPEAKLKHVVGIALSPRCMGQKSGDGYSVMKINNNGYLFAIADGMGCGAKANNLSTTTLSLVENFFKAGLSPCMVTRFVNNAILPITNESFSALDMIYFDSSLGEASFIKMGASVSVLKRNGRSELLSSEALPVGVVANPNYTHSSRMLEKDDVIILASDGIVDSFKCIEDFVKYINNENVQNMQLLAENILEEASARGGVSDDKTVLAIRFI